MMKKRLIPCAAFLNGEYGFRDLFVGVPVIIGSKGIEKIIELPLSDSEKQALSESVNSVQTSVNEVNQKLKF